MSELEVINDLFRGRVSELEAAEQEARRAESAARQAETSLRNELEQTRAREDILRRRLDELEGAGAAAATAAAATAAAAAAAAAAMTTTGTSTDGTPSATKANEPLDTSPEGIDVLEPVGRDIIMDDDEKADPVPVVASPVNASASHSQPHPPPPIGDDSAAAKPVPSGVDTIVNGTAGTAGPATSTDPSTSLPDADADDEPRKKRIRLANGAHDDSEIQPQSNDGTIFRKRSPSRSRSVTPTTSLHDTKD